MPISFTDKFKIQKDLLKASNAFDPIIDLDTKFFIDPALIELCNAPEFLDAREKITNFFSSIILIIKHFPALCKRICEISRFRKNRIRIRLFTKRKKYDTMSI